MFVMLKVNSADTKLRELRSKASKEKVGVGHSE